MFTSREIFPDYLSHFKEEQQYLDVMREVFPLKYEQVYERLNNEVIRYLNNVRSLQNLQISTDNNGPKTTNLKKEEEEKNQEIQNLKEQIDEFLKEDDFAAILNLSTRAFNTKVELTKVATEKEKLALDTHDNNKEMSELQREIEKSLSEMVSIFSEIDSLKIGEMDRLDNLSIQDKHIEAIKSIIDRSPKYANANEETKQMAKSTLIVFMNEYLNVAREGYKLAENVAKDSINLYKDRNLHEETPETTMLRGYNILGYGADNLSNTLRYVLATPILGEEYTQEKIGTLNKINAVYDLDFKALKSMNNGGLTAQQCKEYYETFPDNLSIPAITEFKNMMAGLYQQITLSQSLTENPEGPKM